MISEQLKQAIRESGETMYAVAKNSGIATMQMYRFMDGTRGLTLTTTDRLCAYLGLRLTTRPLPKSRRVARKEGGQ